MTVRHRALALCVGMVVVGAGASLAQDPGNNGRSEPAVRRVPPYFGQVGLTTQQREAIYSIRGKYAVRLVELKRQMEQLQQQELVECESVLNPAQRAQINQRRSSRGRAQVTTKGAEPEN